VNGREEREDTLGVGMVRAEERRTQVKVMSVDNCILKIMIAFVGAILSKMVLVKELIVRGYCLFGMRD
jgi:hypothetical protein